MSRVNLAWLVLLPSMLVLGGFLKFVSAGSAVSKDYERMRMISDVLSLVEENYVDEMTEEKKQKLVTDMLNGGLMMLDRHSMYFSEEGLAEFERQNIGEFGGVGMLMQLDHVGPYVAIESPIANSPAYDAGLQAGDMILAIEGDNTETMKVDEARKRITGKPGTKVRLTIQRFGAKTTEDITLTRATISTHVVIGYSRSEQDRTKWNYLADAKDKIAMIRMQGFNGKTSRDLKAALEECDKVGAKALILDLRDNPGGLLEEAIDVSQLFLASGVICSTKGRERQRSWSAQDENSPWERAAERPMAVLVNRNSASASEIVAAALEENQRAVVIGERSYGKGSVQKMLMLPGERGAVKITSEKWCTPNNRVIHRESDSTTSQPMWGVDPSPGLELKLTDDQWRQYYTHTRLLSVLPGKPGVAPPTTYQLPAETKLPKDYRDPVVQKALEHLRTKLVSPNPAP